MTSELKVAPIQRNREWIDENITQNQQNFGLHDVF